jgi:uncharacterized protein
VRVLLDTNILVSAVLFVGVPRRLLQRALRGEFDVVTSPHLMAEFEEVLARFELEAAVAAAVRSEYEQLARLVRPHQLPRATRDPDDNEVLAAAALGSADLIVTGDRDLLVLGQYEGCRIVTAREFEGIVDASTG